MVTRFILSLGHFVFFTKNLSNSPKLTKGENRANATSPISLKLLFCLIVLLIKPFDWECSL